MVRGVNPHMPLDRTVQRQEHPNFYLQAPQQIWKGDLLKWVNAYTKTSRPQLVVPGYISFSLTPLAPKKLVRPDFPIKLDNDNVHHRAGRIWGGNPQLA